VQFATATQWVARLSEAKRQGSLEAAQDRNNLDEELRRRLCRVGGRRLASRGVAD